VRFVVGLTGGIGSGKSTAARAFGELGADVVDTDAIAHDLTAPGGGAVQAIRDAFGAGMIDAKGALDRPAMRRLVFDDPAARSRLEAILHPAIRVEADLRCLQSLAPYVLLVVPLLVETGGYLSRVERIVVVDCPEQIQVMRTVSRSGIPAEQVRAIMAAQASREARLAVADDVIDNTGDEAALRRQVLRLHQDYFARAATE
jgi:dephospho-CoA kinase